ncbi:hypothetical protein SASPL_157029 [Salvia splendens]|uniref:Retrovirus-related Pol polyprotein from transposon TNT 1-94 n=1 Tax=Salvia splendens TaxID=180675 RepID=A0A8X8YX04_SALSN|nr:hypothetical protein SASPL_157029 [Salvia splendens]
MQPAIPRFDGHYDHWSMLMENLLRSKGYWSQVEIGYEEPNAGASVSDADRKKLEELRTTDLKVKNYLFQAIDRTILEQILEKGTSKQIWDSMKKKFEGNARVKRAALQALRRDFEILEMKVGETITNYFARVMIVANQMRSYGEQMSESTIVEKILRTLTEKFNYIVVSIEESKDIDSLTIDELQSSLIVHEQKFHRSHGEEQALKMVNLGNNMKMSVAGKGYVRLCLNGVTHIISGVFYVPELKNHLLSVGQLQEKGLAILIQSNECKIYHPSRGLIIQTKMTANRMFVLLSEVTNKQIKEEVCLQATTKDLAQLWHRRYGHLSYKSLSTLQLKEMERGLPKFSESSDKWDWDKSYEDQILPDLECGNEEEQIVSFGSGREDADSNDEVLPSAESSPEACVEPSPESDSLEAGRNRRVPVWMKDYETGDNLGLSDEDININMAFFVRAVAWSSRKQPIVTLSTTEAEFVAAAACSCQAVWMKRILKELGYEGSEETTIFCDNSSTIKLSKNPVMHGRSKHIDVRFHFLRELAREGVVQLKHCGTQEQMADVLTKPLKLESFQRLRDQLGVCNAPVN